MRSFLDTLPEVQASKPLPVPQEAHDLLISLCRLQTQQAEALDLLFSRVNWAIEALDKVIESTLSQKHRAAQIEERYLAEKREEARRAAQQAARPALKVVS